MMEDSQGAQEKGAGESDFLDCREAQLIDLPHG